MRWQTSLVLLLVCYSSHAFENFITRSGHQLVDGDKEFRFAGIHAPELHRIERDILGKCSSDPRGWGQYFKWPTDQEQENWIKALVRTGHKAMRIYVLSVADESDALCDRETHILPPFEKNKMPVLNENAMLVYDRMIYFADKHGLRLILPFIDHWEWWGGRKQLAAFYGENENDFYDTNSRTFAAYLNIIEQVVNRKNTYTGRFYREEKAIMAWETGNELKDTNKLFLDKTVAQISKLAPNQLVVDGTYLKVNDFAISNSQVDIISNHFYTVNGNNKPQTIKDDLKKIAGRKVYFVGEFGLEGIETLQEIMDTAIDYEYQGAKTAGAFVWGFRGHRHNGGFYFHKEYTGHYSYRIPGFKEAEFNEEIAVVNMVRNAMARMDGNPKADLLPPPEPPRLRGIKSLSNIRWMGSPLGQSYIVERSESKNGLWQVIGSQISDGNLEFDPKKDSLFADSTVLKAGKRYFYRVIAKNEGGHSQPSNVESFLVPAKNN